MEANRMRKRGLFLAALLASLTTLVSCQTVETTAPGAVGVDRKQRMLVSNEQIEEAAAQAYQQELEKARQQGTLNRDERLLQRVRAISDRLVQNTRVFREDAVGWKWEVNLQDTKELNAYAMPGGKIMVYSGLVERLDLADEEIAAVIGHEIAHALREHSRERVSRAYAQQLALAGAAAVAGVGEGALNLANMVATVTFQLPHSREQETEADGIGLELMARAGYNPTGAVNVWRKMEQVKEGGGPPEFLSTHPSGESRIRELEALLPRVMPLYAAASGSATRRSR
jgi:predicted Zn-dependent protease